MMNNETSWPFIAESWQKLYTDAAERIAALEAQLAAPWTYLIDDKGRAVEGALPEENDTLVLVSYRPDGKKGDSFVTDAYYCDGVFYYDEECEWAIDGEVYAYKPWPAPAPYPVREEE